MKDIMRLTAFERGSVKKLTPMVIPPEPRPVEAWYWMKHKHGHFEVMQWFEGAWLRCADACELWPCDAHTEGWSLHSKIEEPSS